jgi:uncharacterized protein (UPF0332 family)
VAKSLNDNDFKDCLKRGKIKKFNRAKSLIPKELDSAKSDLKTAKESLKRKDYKWATVQAYYSMFHTARALIYSKGYREHSHYCLIVSLKTLFVAKKLLDIRLVEAMQMAKTLRENADYASEFSKSSAEVLVEKAKLFLKTTEEILEK